MNKKVETRYTNSLQFRIWLVVVLLMLTAGTQIVFSYNAVSELQGISKSTDQYGIGRFYSQRLLHVATQLVLAEDALKTARLEELTDVMRAMEKRFERLKLGDPALGIPAAEDSRVLLNISEGEKQWRNDTRPLLESLIKEETPGARKTLLLQLERQMNELLNRVQSTLEVYSNVAEQKTTYANNLQLIFLAVYIIVACAVMWSTRSVLLTLRETVSSLGSGATEILASTAQQSAGSKEQAAAVSQTSTTIEELLQSANQTADKAKGVATSAEQASDIGEKGREALEASIESMRLVKEQSERMAENIMKLAEQAQSIGEIVNTVSEIAEQTNILAINAGIEASRAGEQGAGFNIVAREIKELAYESKRSMVEIRKLLGHIQTATNKAVLGVEEGGHRVEHSITTVNHAGVVIDELLDAVASSAQAAVQIAAAAGQQVNAISQIQQAMKDVNQATHQTVSATRQNEQVAKNLAELGNKLKTLISG